MRVLCPLSLSVFRAPPPHMQLPCILSGLRRSDFKATPSIYIYSTYMVKWAGGDFKTLRFLCYGASRTPNSVELNRRFCKNVIPTQMHIITYVYICVCVCELFNFDFSGVGLVGRFDVPMGFSCAREEVEKCIKKI